MSTVFLADLSVLDPATPRTTTNLVFPSEDFGTTWAAVGTPTRSAAAHTLAFVAGKRLLLDLIGDDAAGTLEGYTRTVTFTADAVKCVSFYIKKGTSTSAAIRLRDTSAGADRLLAVVTWSGNVPTVTMTTGTLLAVEFIADWVYRVSCATTSVTAANTNSLQVYPATDAALAVGNTGNVYLGGMQAENATTQGPYVNTTTVNLVDQSENFGTTWAAILTPTRSAAAATLGDVVLDLIGDNSAGGNEGYSQTVGFTGNGVKAVSVYVQKGTATTTLVEVFNVTGGTWVLLAMLTWSGNDVVLTTTGGLGTFGTVVGAVGVGDGWRVLLATDSLTASNTHSLRIYPASDSSEGVAPTGDIYIGGVQAENAIVPTAYQKRTNGTVALTMPAIVTKRVCTRLGYTTKTTDLPASTVYDPRVTGLRFRYDPSITETIKIGNGELTLANNDGALDDWLDLIFDNRDCIIRMGDDTAALSTFNEVARFAMQSPETRTDGKARAFTVRLRTPLYGLDKALATYFYEGSGSLGGDANLKAKPKPYVFGDTAWTYALPLDNTNLIFQVAADHVAPFHGGPMAFCDVAGVFDSVVSITKGAAYTSVADMIATAPGALTYRYLLPADSGSAFGYGTYIRLGSTPIGEITVHGKACVSDTVALIGDYLNRFLKVGEGGQLHPDDKTAADAVSDIPFQYAATVDDHPSALEPLQFLLNGVRGWIAPYQALPTATDSGVALPCWGFRILDDPATAAASSLTNTLLTGSAAPSVAIVAGQVIAFERQSQYDFGWPEWRTAVRGNKSYFIQRTGIGSGVSQNTRARVGREYHLTRAAQDTTVQTSYPTAVDRQVDSAGSATSLAALASLVNEAVRQNNIFKHEHPTFRLRARANFLNAALAIPGDPMTVTYPRYGADAGRDFQILGWDLDYLSYDPQDGTVTVDYMLWGAGPA